VRASDATPEERFVDSIRRAVDRVGVDWGERVVEAATAALVEGIDSPSLRILAGQPTDEHETNEQLLKAAFAELGLPYPPRQAQRSFRMIHGLLARDSIRFEIAPCAARYGGHEVRVFVNGRDIIPEHAAGMDPQRTLWPTNSLAATATPRLAWVTRGRDEPDDLSVYAMISREGDVVVWDWEEQWGIGDDDFGYAFPADDYDREVARLVADRSWETPTDAVARGVFERADHDALARWGLQVRWVDAAPVPPREVTVSLSSTDRSHLHSPWLDLGFPADDRDPESIVQEIIDVLRAEPPRWMALASTGRPPTRRRRWFSRRPTD
jgi:hypothetical protein